MNLEKLITEGKAKINCSKHIWSEYGINYEHEKYVRWQCKKCLVDGLSIRDSSKIDLLEQYLAASITHNWNTTIDYGWNSNYLRCNICDLDGIIYYFKEDTVIPNLPISCNEYIMRNIL